MTRTAHSNQAGLMFGTSELKTLNLMLQHFVQLTLDQCLFASELTDFVISFSLRLYYNKKTKDFFGTMTDHHASL